MEDSSYFRFIESGSNTFYVKSGAELHLVGGGGSNTTYYETGATIVDSLDGGALNLFFECSEIVFDYYDAPKDGCFDYSSIDQADEIRFSAYPNPATDIVNIEFSGSELFYLVNQIGQVMFSGSSRCRIDVSSYSPGLYHIVYGNYYHNLIIN
jgi:hypothetical protein